MHKSRTRASLCALTLAVLALALAGRLSTPAAPATAGPNIWSPVSPHLVIARIARDAAGGVYALPDGFYSGESVSPTAVYRSSDGGETWAVVGDYGPVVRGLHDRAEVQALATTAGGSHLFVNIVNADTQQSQIVASTDGGATWTEAAADDPTTQNRLETENLVVDPNNAHRLYSATRSSGFQRSTDGGVTWQPMPGASEPPGVTNPDGRIAVDPANPAHLLALMIGSRKVSDDYGTTWQAQPALPAPPPPVPATPFVDVRFVPQVNGPSWVLAERDRSSDPRAPLLFLSRDAGATWAAVTGLPPGPVMGVDSAAGRLYVVLNVDATAAGAPQAVQAQIFTSTDGQIWNGVRTVPLQSHPGDYRHLGLFVSQVDPRRIFRADGAFSTDGGRTWAWTGAPLPSSAVGGGTPEGFWAGPEGWWWASGAVLYHSTDAGHTWTVVYKGVDPSYDHISGVGVQGPAILLQLGPNGIYTGNISVTYDHGPVTVRSTDGGATWQPLALATGGGAARFAFGPAGLVYAAAAPLLNSYSQRSPQGTYTSEALPGGLYRSLDGGTTWISMTVGMRVDDVALDPGDPQHAWAAGPEGLAETRNGGRAWQRLTAQPPVGGRIVVSATLPRTLYATQLAPARAFPWDLHTRALVRSTDDGRTWQVLNPAGKQVDYSLLGFGLAPNGRLAAGWVAARTPYANPTVTVSDDGGVHWQPLSGLGRTTGHPVFDPTTGVLLDSGDLLRSYLPAAVAPDAGFATLWTRQDAPVQAGQAARSWTWGPAPFATIRESLAGLADDSRVVQYYDKSRMEVNDPVGDRSSPWFVTNGLLVVEMVAGRIQTGLNTFEPHAAAQIPVAGGTHVSESPRTPTYAAFRGVASFAGGNNRASDRTGQVVAASLDSAGTVGTSVPVTASVKLAAYDAEAGHNTAAPFWEFLHRQGQVNQNGRLVTGPLFPDPVFVMGRPITEPYWAQMTPDGGASRWVLIQLFERRVLTYTPSNVPAWQVEMGNVGLHYYAWRYGGEP